MSSSLIAAAFAHHAWATLRLVDACESLSAEQLAVTVPGTFGSAIETLRHVVESDADYLNILRDMPEPWFDLREAPLPELRSVAERVAEGWTAFLASKPDSERLVREIDPDDGYTRDAPVGVRLAEALHHGNEHRTQLLAIFGALGVPAPRISVWDYGLAEGRIVEVYPER